MGTRKEEQGLICSAICGVSFLRLPWFLSYNLAKILKENMRHSLIIVSMNRPINGIVPILMGSQ